MTAFRRGTITMQQGQGRATGDREIGAPRRSGEG
jgi:hypothetical protein